MFNWLTGKAKIDQPEHTALHIQRIKQIEQLKLCNQNVVEIHPNVEYRVNFTANGATFSLQITLPPQFPQEKPTVRVTPSGIHAWISEQGTVVGCAALNSFVVHSDLGKVIKEIVDEFQRIPPATVPQHHYGVGYPYPVNPQGPGHPVQAPGHPTQAPGHPTQAPGHPTLPSYSSPYLSQPPTGGSGYMSGSLTMPTLPPMSSTYSSTPSASAVYNSKPSPGVVYNSASSTSTVYSSSPAMSSTSTVYSSPPAMSSTNTIPGASGGLQLFGGQAPQLLPKGTVGSYRMPDIPTTLPQLKDLSVSELTALAEDDGRCLEYLKRLPQLQQISRDREDLIEQVEAQATQNISKQPCIEDRKRIILEEYDLLNELRRQFDDDSKRQDQLRQNFEQSLQDNLKIAAMQAEEEAESIAEQFLEGDMGLNEFKKKFLAVRSKGHSRRAMEERLHDYSF